MVIRTASERVMYHERISCSNTIILIAFNTNFMLCHQEMSRSFMINGSQTAFCTRDIGIIAGIAATLALTYRLAEGPVLTDRKTLIAGILFLLIMAAEWAAGMFIGYDLKYLRLASGVLGGAGIALIMQNLIVGIWKGEGVS